MFSGVPLATTSPSEAHDTPAPPNSLTPAPTWRKEDADKQDMAAYNRQSIKLMSSYLIFTSSPRWSFHTQLLDFGNKLSPAIAGSEVTDRKEGDRMKAARAVCSVTGRHTTSADADADVCVAGFATGVHYSCSYFLIISSVPSFTSLKETKLAS